MARGIILASPHAVGLPRGKLGSAINRHHIQSLRMCIHIYIYIYIYTHTSIIMIIMSIINFDRFPKKTPFVDSNEKQVGN